MRITCNIAIFISILFLPWWVSALIFLAAFIVVDRFFEGVAWGLVADVLYQSPFGYHGISHIFLIWATAMLILSMFLRGKLSWER